MRFFSMLPLLLVLLLALFLEHGYGRNLPVRMRNQRLSPSNAFPQLIQLIMTIMSGIRQSQH